MSDRYHVEVAPVVNAQIGIYGRTLGRSWEGEANAALAALIVKMRAGSPDLWAYELLSPRDFDRTTTRGDGCGSYEYIQFPAKFFFTEIQQDVLLIYAMRPLVT